MGSLTYYGTAKITTVKSFIPQAPGLRDKADLIKIFTRGLTK